MLVLGRQPCQAVCFSTAWKIKPEMPPSQQHSRINVQALKAQMVKRIGPERAKQYFNHFKGYISLRFNKIELDKLVILTIGKENIGLHNEIIKAVLSNAIKSETPPQSSLVQGTLKSVKGVRKKPFAASNDAARARESEAAGITSVWSNGNVCAEAPTKERLGALDQTANQDEGNLLGRYFDGNSSLVDLHRPFKHIEGAAEQSYDDPNDGSSRLGKRPRIIIPPSSPDMNISKASFEQLSSSGAGNSRREEDHHQQWESGFIRSALGSSFYSNNVGSPAKLPFFHLAGSFRQLPPVKGADEEFVHSSDLPSTELLRRHMELVATLEGLEGVNEGCAEILNQGVDSYLKRLIGACIDLVKSRSVLQQGSQTDTQGSSCPANFSSAKRENQLFGSEPSSSGTRKELLQEEEGLLQPTVSLLDFKVAMDLNRQHLGQDWPLQLEKIQLYSFD